MATTKPENAFKHPQQQQVQLIESVGDEQQRQQQTSCNNVVAAAAEEPTNGCVTPIALEKEPVEKEEEEEEEIDEVEQHTQMTTNTTNFNTNKKSSEVDAAALAVTPAAVMVMNDDAPDTSTLLCGKKLLFCRRFKDYGGILRNFNSLPLFVYATSPSTHAISADGVGVAKEAVAAADAICQKNDSYDLALCPTSNGSGFGTATAIIGAMECLPIMSGGGSSSNSSGLGTLGIGGAHHHIMSSGNSSATVLGGSGGGSTPTVTVVGSYQQHLANLHAAHHPHLNLIGNHAVTPYSNNYPLHHSSSHHHIQSEQTKSLQELQHEVGALLEFRDLVIETFPDLKHKMASMSSSSTATSTTTAAAGGNSVTGANTLTGGGGSVSGALSNASLVSRREWEPGIRLKRKVSQKEPSTATASATVTVNPAAVVAGVVAGELSSSSLTRSRSNSHSGKKEPKSGENNNGSVVQDSGFSTETSSSKEGHSASSTNGAMTGPPALNRLSCHESDDELLNLLDVIHRKSSRLREEMDQLQRYERQNLRGDSCPLNANNTNPPTDESTTTVVAANESAVSTPVTTRARSSVLTKSSSSSGGGSSNITVNGAGLTPKTFREHVERLNKEDIKQLRKERDRLLDKLAEMEAETLTGRIKAAKMNDQVEELINVKKDLEEQLKLAMAQKLDLSARVQQLQQQQQAQSKSSSSQSDYSSQRNFLSSAATTVLSTGSTASVQLLDPITNNLSTQAIAQSRRQHTFQPVVVVDGLQQQQQHQRLFHPSPAEDIHNAFHQSTGSDNKSQQSEQSEHQQKQALGRLDGIVSQPGGRLSKCRMIDSKRFAAILLETSVVELQRHLLTLTVQNQVLMQKLDSATKSKSHLTKRLDKSKDDVEDLRFQLEEKNIELEGTKAQLRVLESRIHSVTPSSGAPTNSYLHSQNDYETNRSSASTTLMLSRRGISDIQQYSDMRSATPISSANTTTTTATTNAGQMPAPPLTQISTPSMKAMVHLPMDELQQHSSSTESAHDHELQESGGSGEHAQTVNRLMSASVGGVSPFDNTLRGKKMSAVGSKPSKIPLPGSKAAAYFAGKPPSGRPSTAGRSPPTTHTYAASNSSSKSSLCRSTGNLLYSKSPNSLKRADSAQSIRKDNSSLSTNTSRSSTSSSIPLATHHLLSNAATSKSPIGATGNTALTSTPSPRILQNSPLPKLKRESLTSRVRHLDSLSRVHQHQQNHHSNISNGGGGGGSDVSCTSPTSNNPSNSSLHISSSSPTSTTTTQSYIVSSTPKPSAIAAHLNATLRKDLQLNTNSYGAQQFLRRATGGGSAGGSANSSTASGQSVLNNSATARRFSSASVVGARIASRSQSQDAGSGEQQQQQQQTSDSDSGKVRTLKSTFLGWLKI